jgi:hypothetical protein
MNNWNDIKVGDFIKVLYGLKNVRGKRGIVIKLEDGIVDTLVEHAGYHRWSMRSSLKKYKNTPRIDFENLKEILKSRHNNKKIDNLTYIEQLATINELTKSKKSI